MMTNEEIQTLRNLGHDDAADEIERLREHAVILANTTRTVEHDRCKAKVLQILGWYRNDYNGPQIDSLVEAIKKSLTDL
jgi:hypothetical protein